MSANDVAVNLGRYKDKTIAELVDALEHFAFERHRWGGHGEMERVPWQRCPNKECRLAQSVLAFSRTDPSWQRYSRDSQAPLELEE